MLFAEVPPIKVAYMEHVFSPKKLVTIPGRVSVDRTVVLQALLLRTMESLSEQIMHCASPGAFLS